MAFSESMQKSLGDGGTRLDIRLAQPRAARRDACAGSVSLLVGTRAATLQALLLRVLSASRHWTDEENQTISEAEARTMPHRRHLSPTWIHETISEVRVDLGRTIEPGEMADIEVSFVIPERCPLSGPANVIRVHVQAVMEGQIDPTDGAILTVA
ncbi:MAG: sporulation protein [Nannocystaceae bacterium]